MSVVSTLSVVIGADTAGFTRAADQVQTRITRFGQTAGASLFSAGAAMDTFGGRVSGVGDRITGLAQPFTDIATAGLEAAAGFEDVMTQMETMGGLAGTELEDVRQLALQLGADTKFSASDAAGAMLELVKAGQSSAEAMNTVDDAMALAAEGELEVSDAAAITAISLAQFGLDASDATDAVNILVGAANVSAASVQDIADGLANVGPVANSAGLGLGETAAALAVMSNAGIQGAEAGTQLKSLLLNFNGDTAKGEFEKLGVALYDSGGNARDFDTVLDELKVALDAMTPEDRAASMKNLAGSYGITALNALLAADGIDTTMTAMNQAPTAAELASKSMSTFHGKVDGLTGSVETLMITALTPLMENVLTPLVDKVTNVVNGFTDWAEKNPEAASAIGGVVLAVGALGTGLTLLGSIISIAGLAMKGFGAVLTVATSPIGLLVLAVAGLVAVVSDPRIQGGLKAWQGVFDMLPIIVTGAIDLVTTKLDDAAAGIRTFFRDIEATITDFQIAGTQAQIALNINVDANQAFLNELTQKAQSIDIAAQLEKDINNALASGEPVTIDLAQIQYITSGQANTDFGTDILGSLANQIADPTAIQQAIDSAIGVGDTGTATALIPLGLKLSDDPQAEMQDLLNQALLQGGENGAMFNALLPMATEMEIDTENLVEQYRAAVTNAAKAQTFDVVVDANVGINVVKVGMEEVSMATTAMIQGAAGYGGGGGGVRGYATGGMVSGDGLAYLHDGERVLNKQETHEYNNASSSSGNPTVINIHGVSDIDRILFEFQRMGIQVKPA